MACASHAMCLYAHDSVQLLSAIGFLSFPDIKQLPYSLNTSNHVHQHYYNMLLFKHAATIWGQIS